jgi:diguanylate cyclase (GGDEF)-like protein/PAS domain S-box-containing protein
MPEQDHLPNTPPQKQNDALLANALALAANAIFITDAAGHIVWANRAFSQLSGYSIDEALGHTPALMRSGMQRKSFYAELWRTILAGNAWRGILIDRRKDGELYTVDQTITPLLDDLGVITHFIAIQQDTMPRAPKDEQDHYLAYHDDLTGLPNRAHFLDAERQQIDHARRTLHPFALMFLDLDKFKQVNDSFGHWAGDQLLLAVAERLTRAIRKSDTVARFGGDEFAILLPELPDTVIVATLAKKLNQAIAQPFSVAEKTVSISASIGAAFYPTDGDDPDDLMRKADDAMYSVKMRGGNGYEFYSAASPGLNQ